MSKSSIETGSLSKRSGSETQSLYYIHLNDGPYISREDDKVSLPHSIDVSDNTSSKGKIEKFKWHIKEAQKMMLL